MTRPFHRFCFLPLAYTSSVMTNIGSFKTSPSPCLSGPESRLGDSSPTSSSSVSPVPITPTHFNSMKSFLIHLTLFTLTSLLVQQGECNKLPASFRSKMPPSHVLFPTGIKSEEELHECSPMAVCNKVDTYSNPWVEKQCRCPGSETCSMSTDENDGHTLVDKSRQFKICEPVSKLGTCKYFKDVTWTMSTFPDNRTVQTTHCVCPKNSVAYIFKHEPFETEEGTGYKYLFACSPESRLRCQRKEPCRLFTVRKRPDVEEVNTNTLCQCPRGSQCPEHHSESSVIPGTTYPIDHIKTFTGFCYAEYK